ncbi:hypothetical protein EC957_005494 [Mortierella hygrophila]|uniref:Uncharacterized protein n=1 Tax=Mortierella hygrophila TaxID=979708 RepID=A0A9P6K6P6_9FUNG|nr:hypothetical protein EC957_005494 [Mortierella hygrophila]
MRLVSTVALATSLLLASQNLAHAQDANCSAIYNDFAPSSNPSSAYQKCYTDQAYNTALVLQGANPNYSDILSQICSRPACSHSTLVSANSQYLAACANSIDAENANGNMLQTGKIALELFFAEPIRAVYCTLDPNAHPPPPPPKPPGVPATIPSPPPPSYCLEQLVVGSSNSKFATNLAIYLTSGTIRAAQTPFFETLDQTDTCSPCSQRIISASISYLSENLMPRIGPFYTPEFVQYWTKLVIAYNALCKTSFVQRWPEGTLNVTAVLVLAVAPPAISSSQSAPEPASRASTVGSNTANHSPHEISAASSYSVSQGCMVASVAVAVGASVASSLLPWL